MQPQSQFKIISLTVYSNNLNVAIVPFTHILHSRIKHFKLNIYFISEIIQNKELEVHHILTLDKKVDIHIVGESVEQDLRV